MLNRRQFIWSTAAWSCLPLLAPVQAADAAFGFAAVVGRAQQLASTSYLNPHGSIPKAWQELSYAQYQQIRFKPDRALWHGETLFELQFFHPGFQFDYPVTINVVANGDVMTVAYSPDLFDFGKLDPKKLGTKGLGFAGFRIHYPLNSAKRADEFAVFLGASYFRLIGSGQQYGASARGLAIDTASSKGEEFPIFREFWIVKPKAKDTEITLYALLDSPSVSGAYQFVLRPSSASQADVKAVLFPRRAIDKLGIAPLTSMFLYGENQNRVGDDFRPEVHDSDGLLINAGSGEWIWRPLVNRKQLNVSAFMTENPRGFGLLQRDRNFQDYQDLAANYQRRPSLWVQPLGNWGKGHVELVEIPSERDINDNIVSYWVAEKPVKAGERIELAYLLYAYLDNDNWPPGGRTQATRIGAANRPGANQQSKNARVFVIDFNHGELPFVAGDQPVDAIVSVSSGKYWRPRTQKNPITGGWRASFDFIPDGDKPSDMRCFLRLYDRVLTETWSYLWKP